MLPDIKNICSPLNRGDYILVKRTESDRVVAKAKRGDEKLSRTYYPSGRVVETKSYKA